MDTPLDPTEQAFAATEGEVAGRDFAPESPPNTTPPASPPDPQWSAADDAAGQQAGLA